ncbi:hypothetical protein [Salinimicrobium sp. GXAS 041]|uniref:hypothetical protein n=1 Tax=Salinimicrobium sp. GXAS 041 TaxID=3400806 RepID=UPI003C73E3DA
MNDEKIKTLDVLVDAMEIIENARSIKDLSPDERLELEKTAILLRNIERSIIRLKTDQMLSEIAKDAVLLNDLAEKIEHKAQKLAGVARAIEKAAKVVELFVQIASRTISRGLL